MLEHGVHTALLSGLQTSMALLGAPAEQSQCVRYTVLTRYTALTRVAGLVLPSPCNTALRRFICTQAQFSCAKQSFLYTQSGHEWRAHV